MNDAIRMQLSAYVDGELPENEEELLLRRLSQDAGLRCEVAEYFAISRVIRGVPGVAGADRLHERVLAALDERDVRSGDDGASVGPGRSMKLLSGVAIAATVAFVAIFALQQTEPVGETENQQTVVETPPPVVPDGTTQQELQRQYFLKHADTASELGANGMNSRLVTLEFSEEGAVNPESGSEDAEEIGAQP